VILIKATIIFHSVCGNTYLLAKELYQSLIENKVDVDIFRVEDEDFLDLYNEFDIVKEFYSDIFDIKIAKQEDLLNSDLILLGSPTYFGNVSSEFKKFLDSTGDFWPESRLKGKYLISFTSTGTIEGGGHLCLNSINTYGYHMGMIPISMPIDIVRGQFPAYGIISYSGDEGNIRPSAQTKESIRNLIKYISKKFNY